jgi:hypothetical protein
MDALRAMAQHAKGAVVLAEGDARGAIQALRSAQEVWQRIGAPYVSARVRLLVARAIRALGDEDSAALELDAASNVFVQLGAAPDMRAAAAMTACGDRDRPVRHGYAWAERPRTPGSRPRRLGEDQ